MDKQEEKRSTVPHSLDKDAILECAVIRIIDADVPVDSMCPYCEVPLDGGALIPADYRDGSQWRRMARKIVKEIRSNESER